MRSYLKIKVVSLAAEASLIRREEAKYLARARDPKRAEKARSWARENFWGLRGHRQSVVRPEARAACLAYAFLLGRSYRQCEAKCEKAPDWARVEKLIERYGERDSRVIKQTFAAWKEAA